MKSWIFCLKIQIFALVLDQLICFRSSKIISSNFPTKVDSSNVNSRAIHSGKWGLENVAQRNTLGPEKYTLILLSYFNCPSQKLTYTFIIRESTMPNNKSKAFIYLFIFLKGSAFVNITNFYFPKQLRLNWNRTCEPHHNWQLSPEHKWWLENVAQRLHVDLKIFPYIKLFQLLFLEMNLHIHYYRHVQMQNTPNFLLFKTITVRLI